VSAELRRIEVRHVCGHRVTYHHDLGAFVLLRWHERAERERCRRCLAGENLETLMRRGAPEARQLRLF